RKALPNPSFEPTRPPGVSWPELALPPPPPYVGRRSRARRHQAASRLQLKPLGISAVMVERYVMPCPPDLGEAILASWRTNNRITLFLFEHLPAFLWAATVPGAPRRTIRMIAGHIHNARCMWIKVLGEPHGLPVPPLVDRHRVGARQLLPALRRSGNGVTRLLQLGCQHGGTI